MTNADKIRAMTDDELGAVIADSIDCGVCEAMSGYRPCERGHLRDSYMDCRGFWTDWLKKNGVVTQDV